VPKTISSRPTKQPFPSRSCRCIICVTAKFTHPPKANTSSCQLTKRGQLLHIDFLFWTVPSIRGFTSLLSIIDGKDHMLWTFPTANKRPPLAILDYFFSILDKHTITICNVRVDEDGALANSSESTDFLVQRKVTMETTRGHASFLNGKIERPHRTISQMVRSMLLNSGLPDKLWCYAAETAADIFRYTYHSALGMTPYEAWYGTKPHINNLHVWGCYVYVRVPEPTKLAPCVTRGYYLGFTKSRLIVRWYDPCTPLVKHASAVCFDEYNTKLTESDQLSPGALILSGQQPSSIEPTTCVDISEFSYLGTTPFTIQIKLPPKNHYLGCSLGTALYHNLPYINQFDPGSLLGTQLLKHGQHKSTFWLLSFNSQEFITAPSAVNYMKSLQQSSESIYVTAIFARRIASTKTSFIK